jgi:hypothetical protein
MPLKIISKMAGSSSRVRPRERVCISSSFFLSKSLFWFVWNQFEAGCSSDPKRGTQESYS